MEKLGGLFKCGDDNQDRLRDTMARIGQRAYRSRLVQHALQRGLREGEKNCGEHIYDLGTFEVSAASVIRFVIVAEIRRQNRRRGVFLRLLYRRRRTGKGTGSSGSDRPGSGGASGGRDRLDGAFDSRFPLARQISMLLELQQHVGYSVDVSADGETRVIVLGDKFRQELDVDVMEDLAYDAEDFRLWIFHRRREPPSPFSRFDVATISVGSVGCGSGVGGRGFRGTPNSHSSASANSHVLGRVSIEVLARRKFRHFFPRMM